MFSVILIIDFTLLFSRKITNEIYKKILNFKLNISTKPQQYLFVSAISLPSQSMLPQFIVDSFTVL